VEKGFYQDKKLSLYVAEKIVQAVGAQSPEGFTTGEEMPLPFGIRQVSTGEGFVEGDN
jgi:hypothetical protein